MTDIPAFPTETGFGYEYGMTLRDYFAAKAMQTLLDCDRYQGVFGINRYEHITAERAYTMAYAMMKAREQK